MWSICSKRGRMSGWATELRGDHAEIDGSGGGAVGGNGGCGTAGMTRGATVKAAKEMGKFINAAADQASRGGKGKQFE